MKIHNSESVKAVLLLSLFLSAIAPLHAQNNSWISTNGGFWEDSTNWSAGLPGPTESIFITNGGDAGNIFISFSTSSYYPGSMTVSNFTIGAPDGSENFLNFQDAGTNIPLHILNEFDIEANGSVYMFNSSLQVDDLANVNGYFDMESGHTLVSTLAVVHQLQLNGGVLQVSPGILTADVNLPPAIGSSHVGIGGGTLIHTNGIMQIGGAGAGTFGQTGGTVISLGVQLGGPESIMQIGGGDYLGVGESFFYASQYLSIGDNSGGYSSVSVETNGTLIVTNAAHNAYVNISSNSVLTLDGGVLQMDNLILTNGGSFTNISGTLIYTNEFQVENGSSVTINGGSITTPNNFTLGASTASTGTVYVASGGTLNITNANTTLGIGNDGTLTNGSGTGIASITNATVNAEQIYVGSTAGGLGLVTLQSNAVINLSSNLTIVSGSLSQTSTVTAGAGSMINAPNSTIAIGSNGAGLLTVNGGGIISKSVILGGPLSSGEMHLINGFVKAAKFAANFILVDGGDLDNSGGTTIIGDGHDAAETFNGGTGEAGTMFVGYTPGFTGTYTQSGGTVNVFTNLIVGDCVGGALGVATLTGGTLYVTNATHTAVMDVRNGTFILGAGATLVVDTLVVTNSCGHFLKQGGVLIENNPPILDPNMDADGDGQSNGAELAAGTDPLDPTSIFQMTGAAVSNLDVRVYWTTVGGHSYVVQTNRDLSHGTFGDFSPAIAVPGTTPGTTNYLITNGATNHASFYRVRLGP